MGLSITGYIDLSLTEHQFRDVIEKEINGRLSCIGSNKTDGISRKTRHVVIESPKILEEIVLTWNCSHAAEVLSTCYASIKREDLGNSKVILLRGDTTETGGRRNR